MKKLNALGIFSLLIGLGAVCSGAVPVAGTSEEVSGRLQRSIDKESEKGNYSRVQALRLELAQQYSATGNYALAARQYELLLASRPSKRDRVVYSIELGNMRDADRDYGGAIAAYQDALHDDPGSWSAGMHLARAYNHAQLNSNAIEVYKRCIRLKPSAYEPYMEIARVYQQAGFLNKAVDHYKKALAIDQQPEIYLGLADTYVRQGNVAQAKEVLQEAKSILPRADYDVRLGEIYRRHGDLRKACDAWEEALKVDSQRDDVRLQLALVYDRLNRRADADRVFHHLLAAYPRSALVHFSHAWILYARGDRAGARQEAKSVEKMGPSGTVQHFNAELLTRLEKPS